MHQITLVAGFVAIVHISFADIFTLSLGNLEQYSASLTATPTLSGSKVIFTSPVSSNDGISVLISDELRTNIQQAVNSSCQTVDDKCIENVKSLLINPRTELESRTAGTVVAVSALMGMISAFYAVWIKDRPQPVPIALNIPAAQISQASSAAVASTVALVTGSGTPFVTMTPTSKGNTVTGSQTPAATTFTNSASGHSQGDVVITLSQDLADRVTELIQRSGQCPAGDDFKKVNRFRKRLDDYGAVICGAEQVLVNAVPGAAFGDLVVLHANPLPWTAGDAARAMGVVMDFARGLAQNMEVDAQTAGTVGAAAFVLAWLVRINVQPLGTENTVPENKLEGTITPSPSLSPSTVSATTTTSSSSSSGGGCLATCAMTGNIKQCRTQCPTTTATDAKIPIKTVSIEPWVVPNLEDQIPIKAPVAACLPDDPLKFSQKAFNDTRDNFCKEADISWDEVSWVVDGDGKRINNKARRDVRFDAVVPRDDSGTSNATFWWRPAANSDFVCSMSCGEALDELAYTDCKPKTPDDADDTMSAGGGIDVGCGQYSFAIFNTAKEISVTCRNHPLSAPRHDSDANGGTSVESAINQWCSDNDGKTVDKQSGTDNIYQRYGITQLGVPDRSSFWLRAALTCGDSEKTNKDECKKALLDGMDKCDPNSAVSHGLAASLGCLDYSIDLSGVTKDDSPPWDEKHGFPPPEFIAGKGTNGVANQVLCYSPNIQPGLPIIQDDLNKALDAYCVDGNDIRGFGKNQENFFQYPPKGQPQFYQDDPNQQYSMHLNLGTEDGDNNQYFVPYDDMSWCSGYDWKLGRDDCRYAFLQILNTCNTNPNQFKGGEWVYRCVHYKLWHANDQK